MLTEQKLRVYQLSQPDRFYISEGFLFENPNQAIKFLKDKNLDPQSSQEGKRIFDTINGITRGDGYTNLLTKFHVGEKMPIDDIKKLHEYLKQNKQHVNRLPKPVVTYETYRELRRDLDDMEELRSLKKLYNELPTHLKPQADQLDARSQEKLKKLAGDFLRLKPEQQKFFISKVRGYQNMSEFINSLEAYVTQIESGDDYDAIKNKIETTQNAHLAYADPEKNILIAHINSYDASKKMGCNSQWCIARDPSYWRSYKKGGNKYFYMWDFNYPVNNNHYMVATAYNPNSPQSSPTHLKDDKQTNLDTIINSKGLSYDIFNNYLEQHKQEYLKSLENSTGLLKALRDFSLNTEGAEQQLLDVVTRSEFVQEYSSPDNVEIYNGEIDFDMNEEKMKDALDLDDEYDNVNSMASSYYGGSGYYDDEEANYMANVLSSDNINKIKEIAKNLGVSKEKTESLFDEDGTLKEFLEKYDMESVVDTFLTERAEAEDDAEQRAAKEQLHDILFDVEDGKIEVSRILEYMKENEVQFDTFDQFVEHVRDNIDISSEDVYSARYEDIDYDQLDSEVSDDLDRILEDLDDPNSKYYARTQAVADLQNILQKYGFKSSEEAGYIASRDQKDKIIRIKDYGYDTGSEHGFEQVEDDSELELNIELIYPDGKKRAGWIPVSKLKNYIDQPEISGMQEWKKRYSKLIS